ncbi:SMP-30/gluconolactonase/LRE family protein [Novosphingobium sp. G106]|uniref:SMP-30/gluconolactonase/LRE family protein n=1 Tax=Novosphingobium sp. G106 TaxID=2849500 RepID=UPI001C2D294F|nr:SMP-30/gluconolactonase/LRE family protein [Novosphingobium sp. G106]MBV1691219.1 SMP-30/gluconolactonase/LRE family protein [Novosphingobium sp. G106]
MKLQAREITNGLRFPEGPIVMPDGSVLVVEIEGARLVRCQLDGRREVVAELGGGPNGAALGPNNCVYVCNNGGFNWVYEEDGYTRPHGKADNYHNAGIQRVDLSSGAVQMLYTHCGDIAITGPNDIVFDGKGGFYFTDHGKSYDRLMDRGAIFYAAEDGSFIREVAFPMITPNGVGLSPDGNVLYASETETGRVWAWPILSPGQVQKEPWPSPAGGRFIGGPTGYQRFDSMAIEANGNICVASLVAAGISVFSPEGGLLEFHEAPEPYCTNIAFGGPDMKTAYITLSGYGTLVAVDWPRPGLKLAY